MLVSTLCLSAGGATVGAQAKSGQRFALTSESIARALHNDGLEVRGDDVRLPMLLSTAVQDPALELVGADRLPDGHLRLRLRCRNAGECLTFSVTLAHSNAPATLLAAIAPARAELSANTTDAAAMLHAPAPAANAPVPVPALHAGTQLTLLLEDGHLHIHIPVISLDGPGQGNEIRVASLDRKHTYRATIVNATTVRGIIE